TCEARGRRAREECNGEELRPLMVQAQGRSRRRPAGPHEWRETMMNRVAAAGAAAILAAIALGGADALAVDTFQKLKGSQIQTRFAGMEMTDEVHWGDVYERDGTLKTYSMGHKITGKW